MRKMRRRRKTEDEKDECRRGKTQKSICCIFFKGYVSKHVGVNKSLGLNIWVVKQLFIYEAGILRD